MPKQRVLSGMRPTGKLHLGNMVGALDNWKRLQEEYECFFFAADWHALTTEYAHTEIIQENIRDMVIDWLSVGLSPEKSVLFIQSKIKEHAELHLLLSMITPLPWLERVPSYKEQQQELVNHDLSTYGFLGYPLLQTADIIIYKAHKVPVGIDQVPHVELSREIARRFNFFYGEVFPPPEPMLTEIPRALITLLYTRNTRHRTLTVSRRGERLEASAGAQRVVRDAPSPWHHNTGAFLQSALAEEADR